MSLFSPFDGLVLGLKTYVEGVRWLRAHPRYLALLGIPIVIGLFFLVGGITLFAAYDEVILGWVLFEKPDTWLRLLLYYVCQVLVYMSVVVMTFLTSFLLMNIVAAPIYDLVSVAVERDVTGVEPPGMSWRQTLYVILVEMKKVLLILFVSIVLLFIPGVNVLSSVIAAFLIGWDFFDYPLARRGWSLQQRLAFVRREFWPVLGLGLWLVIPFAQIVMLPLAVAGGTLLNLDALKRQQLLNP